MKELVVTITVTITNESQDFTDVFQTALDVCSQLSEMSDEGDRLQLDYIVDVVVDGNIP